MVYAAFDELVFLPGPKLRLKLKGSVALNRRGDLIEDLGREKAKAARSGMQDVGATAFAIAWGCRPSFMSSGGLEFTPGQAQFLVELPPHISVAAAQRGGKLIFATQDRALRARVSFVDVNQ